MLHQEAKKTWDLTEQVKAARRRRRPPKRGAFKASLLFFSAKVEGAAGPRLPSGCWYLSAVCTLLTHRGSATNEQAPLQLARLLSRACNLHIVVRKKAAICLVQQQLSGKRD